MSAIPGNQQRQRSWTSRPKKVASARNCPVGSRGEELGASSVITFYVSRRRTFLDDGSKGGCTFSLIFIVSQFGLAFVLIPGSSISNKTREE